MIKGLFTFSDGSKAVVGAVSNELLAAQIKKIEADIKIKAQNRATIPEAIARSAGTSFLDSISATTKNLFPGVSGTGPLRGRAQSIPQMALGEGLDVLRNKMPSPQEIIASGSAVARGTDTPTEMQRGMEMRDTHPGSTATGEVLSDVATIAGGRLPVADALRRAEKKFRKAGEISGDGAESARAWNKFINSSFMKNVIKRPGFKAGETGLEGMIMAFLNEGDEMEMALYSAGAQLAGSGTLGVMKEFTSGLGIAPKATSLGKLTIGVAATATLLAVAQNITPMGEGNIFDVLEAQAGAMDKATFALGLGAMSGLAGLGRTRSKDLPMLGDLFTSLPRSALLSLVEDVTHEKDEGGTYVQNAMAHLINDSSVFSKEQAERLGNAFEKGNFGKVANDLAENDAEFAKLMLTEPVPVQPEQQAPVPREMPRMLSKNSIRNLNNLPPMQLPAGNGQQTNIPPDLAAKSLRDRWENLDRLRKSFGG